MSSRPPFEVGRVPRPHVSPLGDAIRRLRAWPYEKYVADHRSHVYDADLRAVIAAAERQEKEHG